MIIKIKYKLRLKKQIKVIWNSSMGVSHKYKCVFVGIPKNASTTISKCLSNKTDNVHDHNTYMDIIGQHDTELLEHYFSFAIVRNPFDRLVSIYHHLSRQYTDFHTLSFKDFVMMIPRTSAQNGTHNDWREDICIKAQFRYVSLQIGGKHLILTDKIFKYEQLQEAWNEICDTVNSKLSSYEYKLNKGTLCKENASERTKEVHEYYDQETFEMTIQLYLKDFELFGYPFELRDKNGTIIFKK
jgi:hypothetical protein